MKKNFLFMSVLTSLFMTGCSREEIAPDGGANGNGEANTSYLAVNLMSSDGAGSRVANGYEDGSEEENKVSKVRFYFFTANGAAANVKLQGNGYVNYYDWEPDNQTMPDPNPGDDVGSKLSATVVINTKRGDKLPQRVAAVLNPAGLDNTSMSLTQLKGAVADYAAANLTAKGKFVMFNSVYGKDGAEVCAVPITADNLQKTELLALAHPVAIYVERSVAKVRVSLGSDVASAGNGRLALADKEGNSLIVDGEQVYLKLDGWSLTAETTDGRLVKKIDPTWDSDWWNGPSNSHRSFWAMNSSSAKNKYGDYDDIATAIGIALYTNENALDYTENSQTTELERIKVILKGTLCKENGDPFTIVRHLGAHFADTYSETSADNLPELKKSILAQLTANNYNYYYAEPEGDQTVRTQIGANDLQIVIAAQEESADSQNNCYVYAQLTEAAKSKTWYGSSDKEVTETVAADVINGNLKNKAIVDWALVWNTGMTYYYYEIIHNGKGENATKGVVRNHVYDTKVTKIAGLGTPVYDPDQVIYPEKPENNDHYIAAEINILSWRIVNSEYELEW